MERREDVGGTLGKRHKMPEYDRLHRNTAQDRGTVWQPNK